MKRHDKGYRGDACQFFVAGELCRRGLVATVTMGNSPNTDILCSNPDGTNFAHIQVKTFIPGTRSCSVGLKSEQDYGPNFFWVLGGIPKPDSDSRFQYYIIPSKEMAKNIRECFRIWIETPGKNGRLHNRNNKFRIVKLPPESCENGWSLEPFLNRWDIIEKCVDEGVLRSN